ncbi:hypothetical protein [Viridibacillus arvi]
MTIAVAGKCQGHGFGKSLIQ